MTGLLNIASSIHSSQTKSCAAVADDRATALANRRRRGVQRTRTRTWSSAPPRRKTEPRGSSVSLSSRAARGRRLRVVLLAEIDGEVHAALPLDRGPAIADPFRPTVELVGMLKLRAAQLRGEPVEGGRLRRAWASLRGAASRPVMAPLAGDVTLPGSPRRRVKPARLAPLASRV